MPGHANSPYWASVDFDSEGDEDRNLPAGNRVYLDPWDNDAFGMIQGESPDSSQDQNMNSFAGEPVSASFYYVPTKTYDSGEEPKPAKRTLFAEDVVTPDYSIYGRRPSRHALADYQDMSIYSHIPIPVQERRRSVYIEEPVYAPHPMIYESLYAPVPMNPYMHPRPRASLQHYPEYMMVNGHGKQRRHSRLAEAYEHYAYETLSPEYEDWARPMPKTAPDNFHLSRYGHLQIDYSCSWNSLDRLIRNQ